MDELHKKKSILECILKKYKSVAVAFSSGVDSTFLLKVAHNVLGENVVAVTAKINSFPENEFLGSVDFCRKEGVRQIIIYIDELNLKTFKENPPDRCYYCKKKIFTEMLKAVKKVEIKHLAEGSNVDDLKDYRPGMKAISELNVISPLKEAGLTKAEIRALSKELDLSTWDKPSSACLASRIAYGESVTKEKIDAVRKAEEMLLNMDFHSVRVRVHGNIARIETDTCDFGKITDPELCHKINDYILKLGFKYVALDLGGYSTGSMNKCIDLRSQSD